MSRYAPLVLSLSAVLVCIAVAIKDDALTTIVGIPSAAMFLCTSAIIAAINDRRSS